MIFRNVSFSRKINNPFWGLTVFPRKSDKFFWTYQKGLTFLLAPRSALSQYFSVKNIPFSHNNSPSPHLLVNLPRQGSTARRGADSRVDLSGLTSPGVCTTTGTTIPGISATSGTTSSQGLVPGQGLTALRGSQSRPVLKALFADSASWSSGGEGGDSAECVEWV